MLTFRNTTFAFFIILLIFNILGLTGFPIHYYYYISLVLFYLAFSIAMSFFIRSGFHLKVVCNGQTNKKIVSLTFDDGPDNQLTPKLLDQLHELGIPATFFCIGNKVEENRDLLQRMNQEGHLLGTHSFTHSNWFDFFSSKRMRKELEESSKSIFQVIGKKPLLFRPPYGVINPMLKKELRGSGLIVIGFSNRAWDTSSRNEEAIRSRIIKKLRPGDIILLHDIIPETIGIIKSLIGMLNQEGYQIISLEKLLNISAYDA
jgi:peptidoglycan/xylan/chitin deacetylase (PgdA/CDA1 family)